MEFTKEETTVLKDIFLDKIFRLKKSYENIDHRMMELSMESGIESKILKEHLVDMLPEFWEVMENMSKNPNVFFTLPKHRMAWAIQVVVYEVDPEQVEPYNLPNLLATYFYMTYGNLN